MDIVDLVDSLHPTDIPTVLDSCWTDDKNLLCPYLDGEQMLNDMIECQDMIAALYYADKTGIDYPKLSAHIRKTDDIWVQSVNVKILSPVGEEFYVLYNSIQNGNDDFGLTTRQRHPKYKNIICIHSTDKMKQFIFSARDNVQIINATQKQR